MVFMTQPYSLHIGDCLDVLKTLDDCSIQTCITSPPYWGLRDYGVDGQLGLEKTPDEYVAKMVEVFREVRRVLRDDGTLWLNLGDSYTAGAGSQNGLNSSGLKSNVKNEATRIKCLEENKLYKSKPVNGLSTGLKPKDLVGIPWRVAFALQADGWYLRQDIIWHKPNPMPESVTDRCTKAHEYIFLMSKSAKYYYDHEAIQEESVYPNDNRKARQNKDDYDAMIGNNGQIRAVMNPSGDKAYPFRNRRSVWTVSTRPFKEAHFATFPPQLIEPCVKAGSKEGDTILDPFNGAGTTGLVACRQNRNYIGIELNPEYAEIARNRIENELNKAPLFTNA
jgi:DNA modification methylase